MDSPTTYILLIAFFGTALVAAMFMWPKFATLSVVFLFYTNIPVLLKKSLGLHEYIAGSFILLLLIPLSKYILLNREKVIIDGTFVLMLVYLATGLLSLLFAAKDLNTAFDWVISYLLEGIFLYLLIVNVIRTRKFLNQVLLVLLFSGSLLGGLSLYQDITQSYTNTFFGLAQRKLEVQDNPNRSSLERVDVGTTDRASGSIGESNRYAQIMLVILPLALPLFLGAQSWYRKTLLVIFASLILCGILLTFSRGAFLILILMLFLLVLFRIVKPRHLASAFGLLFLLIVFGAPGYLSRMESIKGVSSLFSEDATHEETDPVILGRATEMLAALNAYLDHPILGVGPMQYLKHYSLQYQSDPDIALRTIDHNRRAHTLYFELAAEMGTLGFIAFMSIVLYNLFQLWQLRQLGRGTYPDITNLATALMISMFAYLGTAIFLHLSYQRYYWFLIALVSASIHIMRSDYAFYTQIGNTLKSKERSLVTSDKTEILLAHDGERYRNGNN